MITGTSQADAAVLVVAAPEGVMAQTKEHVFLAKTLGVNQIIIDVNKMDATKPSWSEQRFNDVKAEVGKLLKMVGYKDENVQYVPTSGFTGENVVKKQTNMPWWKGHTLLECLDNLSLPQKPTELPLRLPVQDVYTITGIGTVPVGRIETGVLKVGDNIVFSPSGATGEVKTIEMHHEQMPKAEPGDNIGFNVRGVAKNDIKRGDVAGPTTSKPTVAKTFTAQIAVLQHPSVIAVGYTPVFHLHTAQVACTFEEIVKTIDPRTGQTKADKPDFIKTGDIAIVKVRPTRPLVIEKVKEFPQLGRFAIRDMGTTVAAGMCLDIEKKE
jgi:elongation factor 1-alpha